MESGLRLARPFYLHSTLLGQRKGPAGRRVDPALELSAGRENSNALSWERSREGGQGGQSSGRRRVIWSGGEPLKISFSLADSRD